MRRRGFTLVELSVVIVLMAMFAAAMVPRVATVVTSQARRGYRLNVLRLVNKAHEEAIRTRQTVTVKSDSGTFRLSSATESEETVIESVEPVNGVEVTHFVQGGNEIGEAEWAMAFYPDGTCDGGSFQFDEGQDSKTVSVRKRDGKVTVTEGDLSNAQPEDIEWDAGGYVQTGG